MKKIKYSLMSKLREALRETVNDEKKNRAKMIIDGSNLLFFFTFKNEPYGSTESGRVTFAKMKDPKDEDNTEAWRKEVNFTASNLYKCVDGEQNQTVFSDKDLGDIKVLDKDEVEKMLNKYIQDK